VKKNAAPSFSAAMNQMRPPWREIIAGDRGQTDASTFNFGCWMQTLERGEKLRGTFHIEARSVVSIRITPEPSYKKCPERRLQSSAGGNNEGKRYGFQGWERKIRFERRKQVNKEVADEDSRPNAIPEGESG
jgi:hypothetical protein